MSAYRKGYSTNHVLTQFIENWRKPLDKIFFTGAVLIDLSQTFDYIPHDFLIAKLHAYGLGFGTVTCRFTYLKKRKQKVSINNISSLLEIILSGVPQGLILASILCKYIP